MRLSFLVPIVMPLLLSAADQRATIIDTGSTNRAGMTVSFDERGNATVEARGGETKHIQLNEQLCKSLFQDLKSARPLTELPTRHCMKSVSFGSYLYVEFEGQRTPDLSCPGQLEPRADTLQKSAREILKAAQDAAGIRPGRLFTAPRVPVPAR